MFLYFLFKINKIDKETEIIMKNRNPQVFKPYAKLTTISNTKKRENVELCG